MKRTRTFAALSFLITGSAFAQQPLRLPAVPLVTSDPYLSIWSQADHLTDDVTRHWTKHPHSLVSLIQVDGKSYRLMGNSPAAVPAMPQTLMRVLPTRSIYEFDNGQVHVTLTFMTPTIPVDWDRTIPQDFIEPPSDLYVLARPVTYLTWEVKSVDGAEHDVSVYDSASSNIAVNDVKQKVGWSRETYGRVTALKMGTVDQHSLMTAGDDVRIDWGYAYLAAPSADSTAAIGDASALENQFVSEGKLPGSDDSNQPRAADDSEPAMAVAFSLGKVGRTVVSRHAMVAYDEEYSVVLFGKKLRPYWRRNETQGAPQLLQQAEGQYASLLPKCEAFDNEMMADLAKVGGEKYAQIAAGAYREAFAGNGLVADANGKPLLLPKENTSDGDIATVDVMFPMEPIFLLVSPTLAKASLVPILNYAASPHWKFPSAPHDLGFYPRAYGTDDGGEGMPVEESGNMLILCDAVSQIDGNADFVSPWWPQLTQWGHYLEKYGVDPEEQLCTDDFMGHLAHNSNLSVKAIVALAAYGDLCRLRGDAENAKKYMDMARADAKHWTEAANDGDHYRLAFDKPGTWSQKYNLVWDRLLGLNVFSPEVAKQEVGYYKTVMQKYGLPLDSRTHVTKTDWTTWSATLADNKADFETLMSPVFDYLNQTSAHVPMVDSYTTDNVHSDGMHARPVIGGVFIKMLADKEIWKKWASRDQPTPGRWADQPDKAPLTQIVPVTQATTWKYTIDKPGDGWETTKFDDSSWKMGLGAFGTLGTPNLVVGTLWNTGDIWLRREVKLPETALKDPRMLVYHDEDVEVYLNGVLACKEAGFTGNYHPLEVNSEAEKVFTPGATVTIAVHCHQTEGGQGVDVGIYDAAK